jgi:hypothetical protein
MWHNSPKSRRPRQSTQKIRRAIGDCTQPATAFWSWMESTGSEDGVSTKVNWPIGRLQVLLSMRLEINFSNDSNVICPVQTSREKYSASAVGQISGFSPPVSPKRGAGRDRHERGLRCGGRGSVERANGIAGQVFSCERSTSARTNGASTPSPNFGRQQMAGRGMWWRCCVR